MKPVPGTSPGNIEVSRVNPGKHPDWAGVMNPSDCVRARSLFNGRIAYYDPEKRMIFWSRTWTIIPEGDQFELPFGAKYKTCTLLVRMAKDYGTGVLPIGDDYMDFSNRPPWALIKWEEIVVVLQSLLNDIGDQHWPVWTVGAGYAWDVVVMFIPTRSVMSRRWATDMRATWRRLEDILAHTNGTVIAVA
ncbi:MAG: hypothetical protein Q9186_004421 [Xanthomendoza sp. 1 TL-2023]